MSILLSLVFSAFKVVLKAKVIMMGHMKSAARTPLAAFASLRTMGGALPVWGGPGDE